MEHSIYKSKAHLVISVIYDLLYFLLYVEILT